MLGTKLAPHACAVYLSQTLRFIRPVKVGDTIRAIAEVIRMGWGKENPVFRQIFTARFMPGANDAQLAW